jgi:hypothetical protein
MNIMSLLELPFEEKLKLLSDADKDYLRGYIDRAVFAAAGYRPGEPEKERGASPETRNAADGADG